jgi:hypothetical protein
MAATCGVQAAMITSQVSMSGTDFISGDSALIYTISNTNSTDIPLTIGQEIVTVSSVDSMLATGKSSYQSELGLQNGELILLQSERTISTSGPSAYSESLFYDGVGAGSPELVCGVLGENTETSPATKEGEPEGNETITVPAVDPYCSMFMIGTGMIGSGLLYQSTGAVQVGDVEIPDALGLQFGSSGNGIGTLTVASMSRTPGYFNQMSQRIHAGGEPFTLEGKFQFTSFAKTFDLPTVEG